MVSKRWQKQHFLIQHSCLAFIWGSPLFLLQLSWPVWLKLLLIALIWIVGLKVAASLNNRYAKTMVRIFRFEHDLAVGVVQQVLRKRFVHFSRQNEGDVVRFKLRERGLTLTIESFPLNLPIDDHIKEVPASKVELNGLNSTNKAFAELLAEAINEMANIRIYKAVHEFKLYDSASKRP